MRPQMRPITRLKSALFAAPLVLALAVSVAGPTAQAQKAASSAQPGVLGSSNLPIDISADNSEQFREERRAVWYGNVEAIQGTSRLKTPRLTVFYKARDPSLPKPAAGDPGADVGQVERIEAEGPVYYVTPTQKANGDHATYLADNDTITLTGRVVVVQDKDVATGDKLVIEQKTGHSTLTSTAGKTGPQRVRAVLYPGQKVDPNAPAPPAKAAGHP